MYEGIGLLRNSEEIIPPIFEIITKPKDNLIFAFSQIPNIPYLPQNLNNYFCYLYKVLSPKDIHSCFASTQFTAINKIKQKELFQLLEDGAFDLQKDKTTLEPILSNQIKKYINSDLSFLFKESDTPLFDLNHKSAQNEYYVTYDILCDKKNPKDEDEDEDEDDTFYDYDTFNDALEGEEDAWGNID